MNDAWQELRVSNEAEQDSEELRRRLADEGYLFFRRLLDPEKVLTVRADILGTIGRAGWLQKGSDVMAGIADVDRRCTEGDEAYNGPYGDVQRLESFHTVPHDPQLMNAVERIFDTPAIPLPGHKARIWFPKFTAHTTAMHQDFVHYQGSLDTLTCWMPVGDCPIELGPLAVLEGSDKVGKVLPHHFALGAGGLGVDLEGEKPKYPELSGRWLSTNFEAGDALFFPATTVHRALPNTTEDRIRVSLDNRYQREGGRIAEHMLLPHMYDLHKVPWEDIYRDWESDELKYYWHRRRFRKIDRSLVFVERGFAEAMELAEAGDSHAILAMERYIKASPDAEHAPRVRGILAKHAMSP
ncbi:MAG: phytanoyl-CoA dioxygenase family protein [Salinibacterium sp.]|nr:phytanoyl-CoA dioxygenase family protein [Salinibacterium sp.]